MPKYQCWSIGERSHLGYVHTAFFGRGMDMDSASITVVFSLSIFGMEILRVGIDLTEFFPCGIQMVMLIFDAETASKND